MRSFVFFIFLNGNIVSVFIEDFSFYLSSVYFKKIKSPLVLVYYDNPGWNIFETIKVPSQRSTNELMNIIYAVLLVECVH